MKFQIVHLDSLSGAIAHLPKSKRTVTDALLILSKNGKVSAWDMETLWIRSLIQDLEREKLIEVKESWFPWYVYKLTDLGYKILSQK